MFGRDAPAQIADTAKVLVAGTKSILNAAGTAITNAVQFIVGLVKKLFNAIAIRVCVAPPSGLASSLRLIAFNAIFKVVADATNVVINAIKSIISAVITPIQSTVSSISKSIPGYVQSTINSGGLLKNTAAITNTAVSTVTGGNGGFISSVTGNALSAILPKYKGQIPNSASGFLGAVATESRNAPSDADLVLANSSEYILTRQQMSHLVNGLSTSGRTVNVNFSAGAIALNLPAGTPQEIALQAISRRLDAERIAIIESRLALELEARL